MRLFIAVNFSDEIKSRILLLQDKLRSRALRGNFTRQENLHLTLAFLGETPGEKLDCLYSMLSGIKAAPFEIRFNHTGCFTHSRKELWWIGADKNSTGVMLLDAIHEQLLGLLLEAGFSVDTRPFRAHITLGREIKKSESITLACPEILVQVRRISLMQSEHKMGQLSYTELFGQDLSFS